MKVAYKQNECTEVVFELLESNLKNYEQSGNIEDLLNSKISREQRGRILQAVSSYWLEYLFRLGDLLWQEGAYNVFAELYRVLPEISRPIFLFPLLNSVKEISLLSVPQAQALSEEARVYGFEGRKVWWLKTLGQAPSPESNLTYIATVGKGGVINYGGRPANDPETYCRPFITIPGLDMLGFEINEPVPFVNTHWIYIENNRLLCDGFSYKMPFGGDDYEHSKIKHFIEEKFMDDVLSHHMVMNSLYTTEDGRLHA